MIRIRINVALERQIRTLASAGTEDKTGQVMRKLVALMDDAGVTAKRVATMSPMTVVSIIRRVMGTQVRLTPALARGDVRAATPLLSFIKNRVAMLGLTEEEVELAAERALRTMQLPTSIEWVVKSLDKLLAPDDGGGERVVLGLPEEQ